MSIETAAQQRSSKITVWNYVVRMGPVLISEAREAQKKGESYRGFAVGAAAVGVTESGNIATAKGFNFKPYPDGPRECAEQDLIKDSYANKISWIAAIAVAGPPQKDSVSGLELPTLPLCGETCRPLLNSDPLIKDETVVITVHPNRDMFQIFNVQDYLHQFRVAEDEEADISPLFEYYEDSGFKTWTDGASAFERLQASLNVAPEFEQRILSDAARHAVTGQLTTAAQLWLPA